MRKSSWICGECGEENMFNDDYEEGGVLECEICGHSCACEAEDVYADENDNY